jgi:hypothetical protein
MEPAARARGHPRWLLIADEEQLPAEKGPLGRGLYSSLPLNPTRGWGLYEAETPGLVSMTVSAEPSTATNISVVMPALGTE